jgi:hypothetical protein
MEDGNVTENNVIARLLVLVVSAFLAATVVVSARKLTLMMAEAAVDAQTHQMEWGQFSRQLWRHSRP